MGKRDRARRLLLEEGLALPFRNEHAYWNYFYCGRCKQTLTENNITEHLIKCMPQGARCDRCGDVYKPEQFLEHYRLCTGKKERSLRGGGTS